MGNSETTPMMRQYNEAKAAAGDALLLFRMGDFYELFFDDAYKAADTLGIAVTSRDRNKNENATPMAGFPHHQLDSYLARLVSAGYKVAVCEQMEDPKTAKSIVKREVIRIVTPGTVTEDSILDPRQCNYLAAIACPEPSYQKSGESDSETRRFSPETLIGLSWVELSTGQFYATTLFASQLFDQIARINPAECLVPESAGQILPENLTEKMMLTRRPDWMFSRRGTVETLLKHFRVSTLEGFGFTEKNDIFALQAAGVILDYLIETQKQSLEHIETLVSYRCGNQLEIDEASRRSLEIVQTNRDRRREGSLLSVLDRCVTAMGSRLLTEWVNYPLTDLEQIQIRQDAVQELIQKEKETDRIRDTLRGVYDLERILSKVIQNRAQPRDLVGIGRTLKTLTVFKEFLENADDSLLKSLGTQIDLLSDLSLELEKALGNDPPLNYRDGGFIRQGYSAALDEYRQLQRGGKEWLTRYQASEIERTGISSLKVGFTSVFGYYLEITNTNRERIPENYVRKQTLKNAERYITPELKQYEEKVLQAEERAKELEFRLFELLRQKVVEVRVSIQRNAVILARLDALAGLATLARTRGYCRPRMVAEAVLRIVDGRHPVLDMLGTPGAFVPNSAFCDEEHGFLHLITGPNMAGKSTYIRQIALLTLMAQIGSFIPAQEAEIGVVDRIFARVGASDELARGQSTFMVEMIETARILNNATSHSLVILDEIGRGTSTYDGISLAWAIMEFLHEHIKSRTFFATHYHELTDLAETCPNVSNLNVAIREWNDEITFLHKIVPGAADKSYGIHVARLAGVPREVVQRAKSILKELENSHVDIVHGAVRNAVRQNSPKKPDSEEVSQENALLAKKHKYSTASGTIQFSLFGPEDHPIIEEIRSLDLYEMTPLQTFAAIERWKKLLDSDKK